MNSNQVEALLSRRVGVDDNGDPVWIIWSGDEQGNPVTGWEPEKDRRLNITVGVGAYQYTSLTVKQARDLAINILDKVGV